MNEWNWIIIDKYVNGVGLLLIKELTELNYYWQTSQGNWIIIDKSMNGLELLLINESMVLHYW